jgi:GxxExxY protein
VNENEISYAIIGAAIEVHRTLGPGLLESVYENALSFELQNQGLYLRQQQELPVIYKGRELPGGFRIDLLVEDLVIVEVKAVEKLLPVHEAQLLTYLKLANKKLGLLLNFNSTAIRNSIRRVVNNL